MGDFWIMVNFWIMGDFWILGDFWIMGDLWIMVDFPITGGESTQTNKQTHRHINTMTPPGPGAGPSKNDKNTKHLNAEIQMTYI